MDGQLPKRVGEFGHALVTPEKVRAFPALQLTQNTSWSDLVQEYTLFTPALLYLSVPLLQDPFDAFQQETGLEIEPQQLIADSGTPLFSGLAASDGDLSWTVRVLCAPKDLAAKLHEWVQTTKYLDSSRGLLWQPKIQRILVRDDVIAYRQFVSSFMDPCPKVLVEAWAVHTTRGRMFFGEVDSNDPRYVVPARFSPEADSELIAFRDRLIQGANPYGVESQ